MRRIHPRRPERHRPAGITLAAVFTVCLLAPGAATAASPVSPADAHERRLNDGGTAGANDLSVSVREVPRAPAADPRLFDELEALEDPALASYSASGDLTNTELVLVIIFIIFLFPVGIILLIIFLLDED